MAQARSMGSALFWAATWALGVALGVALGGWLTVVGGAGTPGVESLDLVEDVVLLPGAVALIVFTLYLAGYALVGAVRGRGASSDADDDEQDQEPAE